MSRRFAQLGVAAALAVTAFLPSSASAVIPACTDDGYLNPYALNVPGFVNCEIAYAGTVIGRVGACTSAYQPFAPPFGTGAVGQTQTYVDCLY